MVLLNELPIEQLTGDKESAAKTFREIEPVPIERAAYNENSAFNLYLKEVATTKLLTPDEEIALAARIKKGDAEAVEHMIKANLRLVIKIAHDYEHFGLPLLDLINEGNIGLMKAVKRFDPSKGGKLSTYGAWWIKQSIKRALSDQSKTIRLPVHVVEKLSKIRRACTKLEETLGHEPTDEDVADELNMSARRVGELRTASAPTISLDAPVGDGDGNSFGEMVADENSRTPLDQLELDAAKALLVSALETLPSREQEILRYRYGLDGGNEKTLEEVGLRFHISRERVRQLQNTALSKLRRQFEMVDVEKSRDEGHHTEECFMEFLNGKNKKNTYENSWSQNRSVSRS
ncbi:MAG: RpoD family polymerase sigma factor [Verrucomicrobiales bacterium]|nr:RpoD family polymerase sigma factor [Verrucomicrobiales bacterium]